MDESEIIVEILSSLKSFKLTEVGVAIYTYYEEEQKRLLSLLKRSHSANSHVDSSIMSPTPKIQRSSSDPYHSNHADHVPTRIELMTSQYCKPSGSSPLSLIGSS